MAWMTLGTALENALASMLNDGEGAAATALSAGKLPKRTGAVESPGQVSGGDNVEQIGRPLCKTGTTQPGTMPASSAKGRGRATHAPAPPQRRVARPMLFVIDGGRPAQGGAKPGGLRYTAGRGRRSKLMLVSG